MKNTRTRLSQAERKTNKNINLKTDETPLLMDFNRNRPRVGRASPNIFKKQNRTYQNNKHKTNVNRSNCSPNYRGNNPKSYEQLQRERNGGSREEEPSLWAKMQEPQKFATIRTASRKRFRRMVSTIKFPIGNNLIGRIERLPLPFSRPERRPWSPRPARWLNESAKRMHMHRKEHPKEPNSVFYTNAWLVGSVQHGHLWEKYVPARYYSLMGYGFYFLYWQITQLLGRLKDGFRGKRRFYKKQTYCLSSKKHLLRLKLLQAKVLFGYMDYSGSMGTELVKLNLRGVVRKRQQFRCESRSSLGWIEYRNYDRLFSHKQIHFYNWSKYSIWWAQETDKYNIKYRVLLPHSFRHTQRHPWRYYRLVWWNYKSNKWLSPIIHNRKLFPYHFIDGRTAQKKHPHQRKRCKMYNWLTSMFASPWRPAIKGPKHPRIKQLLYRQVVLPAYGRLKQKQFLAIKKNVSHIKPTPGHNSRPGIFLGKFERRIDVLAYKLNFAPTIQWARDFVESGLVYVSHLEIRKFTDYKWILTKHQKFPLLKQLKQNMLPFFKNAIYEHSWTRRLSKLGRKMFNMPLPVTLAAYRVRLKGIVHWSSQNIRTYFYSQLFNKFIPGYFMQNKNRTISYFWRNLRWSDVDKSKAERIKQKTFLIIM